MVVFVATLVVHAAALVYARVADAARLDTVVALDVGTDFAAAQVPTAVVAARPYGGEVQKQQQVPHLGKGVCPLCKLFFFFREMRFYVLHHRTAFGATARTVELKVDAGFKSAHPL